MHPKPGKNQDPCVWLLAGMQTKMWFNSNLEIGFQWARRVNKDPMRPGKLYLSFRQVELARISRSNSNSRQLFGNWESKSLAKLGSAPRKIQRELKKEKGFQLHPFLPLNVMLLFNDSEETSSEAEGKEGGDTPVALRASKNYLSIIQGLNGK